MKTEPTDEQLNIAVCEWLGWTIEPDGTGVTPPGGRFCGRGYKSIADMLPNHITGIEALGHMAEAEKLLTNLQVLKYETALAKAVQSDWQSANGELPYVRSFPICATARQRAIALHRTINNP